MKFKNVFKDGFYKAVLTLTSGSLIAQLITILASPILTRVYTPSELGLYTLILTAESIFGGILCARYDVAIVSEKAEKNVYILVKLCAIFTVIISLIASTIYGVYYFVLQDEYNDYSYAIIIIFVMLVLRGFITIFESYNNRHKEYKVMTQVYVLRTSVQNFGSVLLGILNFGVFGMLISHVLGMIMGLRKLSQPIKNYISEINSVNNKEMIKQCRNHYKLPLFSAPANFANKFSYASIMIFIEVLFNLATLGYYSIAYKVLGLPISVLSNNIAKVFYQQSSIEYQETRSFIKTFKKTSFLLILIAIPMVLILELYAPQIFELAFGQGWDIAGVYVQILAPMFGIRLVVMTVVYGLQVVNKQQYELILQSLFLIASLGSFGLAMMWDLTIEQFLLSITISFSTVYAIFYWIIFKYALGNRGV